MGYGIARRLREHPLPLPEGLQPEFPVRQVLGQGAAISEGAALPRVQAGGDQAASPRRGDQERKRIATGLARLRVGMEDGGAERLQRCRVTTRGEGLGAGQMKLRVLGIVPEGGRQLDGGPGNVSLPHQKPGKHPAPKGRLRGRRQLEGSLVHMTGLGEERARLEERAQLEPVEGGVGDHRHPLRLAEAEGHETVDEVREEAQIPLDRAPGGAEAHLEEGLPLRNREGRKGPVEKRVLGGERDGAMKVSDGRGEMLGAA